VWRREVERRRRKTWLWAAGAAVAATAVIGLVIAQWIDLDAMLGAKPTATIVRIEGNLQVEISADTIHTLAAAEAVRSGKWLYTDTSSRALIQLASGHQLRMDTDTRIVFEKPTRIRVDRGAVYVDSATANGRGLAVVTDLGTARDIGTRFEVRHSHDELVVRVRDGQVELTRASGRYSILAGVELSLTSDGSASRREIRADGPEWDWTLEVCPSFQLDEATALGFMQWVAAETGRTLRFSTPEVEAFASDTVLHGTVNGMNPGEAAETILPSCGLESTIVAGTIIVRRAPPGGS